MQLMTAKQASKYIGKGYVWTTEMFRSGKIKAYKAGGSWRTTQENLDKYLEKNSNQRRKYIQ